MDYKIVVDSCGELTPKMRDSECFVSVPLSIDVGNCHIVDDASFDQAAFLKLVSETSECPKSSCPSPEVYMDAYRGDEQRVYVVTLSGELSGSYNSAEVGKDLYEEEYGKKNIHVFNSKSASVGETLIAQKIQECEEKNMSFAEVILAVNAYIAVQRTYFVLETLETLRKNGRLTGVKALLATALNIKPVMGSTNEGAICQLGQARGMKKALAGMVNEVEAGLQNTKDKILGIAHCNCRARAEHVKEMLLSLAQFKDVILLDTGGIGSMYAADGGVIVCV